MVIFFKVVRWGGCGVSNFEETGGVFGRLVNFVVFQKPDVGRYPNKDYRLPVDENVLRMT